MQGVTGWRMASLSHSHFPLSPSDTQQLHPPPSQPPFGLDGRCVRLHDNGHWGHKLLHNKNHNQLSVWFDLETFSTTDMFWMLSLVWFCEIILLTRYYSLFIQESWRWLGNSVQPLKIDSCFLSAEFLSAFWAVELSYSLSFFMLSREMLEPDRWKDLVTDIYSYK